MKRKNILRLFIFLIGAIIYLPGIVTAEDIKLAQAGRVGEVFELGEIVVAADRNTVNLATTVTEITAEDITAGGARTVADALNLLPGVDIQQGGKNSWVYLRGFDQEDIKVLIDGVPAYQTYDKVVDLSLLPVDSIAKITVTKGASSVLYGANTFGGVINIITKKGGKEPEGEVSVSFGENSTQNYVFNYGGSKNSINYWLTFSHRKSDGFDLSSDFDPNDPRYGMGTPYNEDGGLRDLSHYKMNTFSAKVGYEPDSDTKLYVSYDYHNNEKGIPTSASRYWSFVDWDQWHVNIVGEKKITEILKTRARLYYVSHEDTVEDVSWDVAHTSARKWFETSSYDDTTTGLEIHNFLDFGPKSFIKIGFNYVKDNHKQQDYYDDTTWPVVKFGDPVGYLPEEEYEADTFTVAVEDEISFNNDKFLLVMGVSYDNYRPEKAYDKPVPDSTDSFNPQAGMVYNLSPATSFHASVGKKIRFPRLKELYSDMAGGNPEMKPQETISYEIGADHSFNMATTGSIAFFYNDISDLIERIQDPVTGDRYYTNVGKALIEGMELSLTYKPGEKLSMEFGYTYLSTEDKTNNVDLQYRPRHKLSLDTRYRFLSGFATNVQLAYKSGAYEYDPTNNLIQSDGAFLVSARVEKEFGKFSGIKQTTLFAQGYNLFDKHYTEGGDLQAGFSFLAGFNVRF